MVAAARVTVVEPITSTIETKIRAAHTELLEAEAVEREADERAKTCRAEAQRRRIELGRLLREARPRWPERGPNAKGWGEFLRRVGVHEQSAREWINLAEAIEVSKPSDGGLEMTRAEIRAAKKAREQEREPRKANADEVLMTADRARRLLRSAYVRTTEGAHPPGSLLELLGDWHLYSDHDRAEVRAEFAAELEARLAEVKGIP